MARRGRVRKYPVSEMQQAIEKAVQTYRDDVIHDTKVVIDEVSKEATKLVKASAPVRPGGGKYKRSLTYRNVYESLTERRNVIYASKGQHRLTHLLEHGHLTKNGKKKTKAQPHFAQGQKYLDDNFVKRLKEKLNN